MLSGAAAADSAFTLSSSFAASFSGCVGFTELLSISFLLVQLLEEL
jgi:hypothetical protein